MHEAIPFAAELEERTDRVIEPVVVLDLALHEDPEVVPGHAAAFRESLAADCCKGSFVQRYVEAFVMRVLEGIIGQLAARFQKGQEKLLQVLILLTVTTGDRYSRQPPGR